MEYVSNADQLQKIQRSRWLLLALPLYYLIVTAWMIDPLSVGNVALAYAAPLLFGLMLPLFQLWKVELAAILRGVRIELALTLLMAILALLSVINSNEPFRVLRILLPSLLPTLMFFQLAGLRQISPKSVERLPRHFLLAGLVFCCLPLLLSPVLGPFHSYLFDAYRYKGMFENPNQIGVMTAVLIPLVIVEAAVAKKHSGRWLWITVLVLLLYSLVRIGSKTSLFVTAGYAWFFYLLVHARFHSRVQNILRFAAVIGILVFLFIFGLQIAYAINPTLASKIEAVFSGGLENYATIEARKVVWQEAWNQGTRHWLIGTGAGERILGATHAHNLILDYFRCIGLFGAFAIVALCLRIFWRAAAKTIPLLLGQKVESQDMRILACYVSAAVYVLCNQMSNSFGPATIAALWIIYLPAVLSEPRLSRPTDRQPPHLQI